MQGQLTRLWLLNGSGAEVLLQRQAEEGRRSPERRPCAGGAQPFLKRMATFLHLMLEQDLHLLPHGSDPGAATVPSDEEKAALISTPDPFSSPIRTKIQARLKVNGERPVIIARNEE
ncbi:hypothetical protein AAC387_Pa04g1570 [Persea americana]